MNKAELWHFYYSPEDPYLDRPIRDSFCPSCQEYHVREYPEDRLVIRFPEPGEACDGCGISAVEVDEE